MAAETGSSDVYQLTIEGMTGLISALPVDIIMDIFCRLPTKHLSQCRWVSKSWYRLIHLPTFQTKHNRAIKQHRDPPTCFLFENWCADSYSMVDGNSFDSGKTLVPFANIQITLPDYVKHYTICDSVNGLICFTPLHDIFGRKDYPYHICNPVTGDYVTLPMYSLSFSTRSGFGYDSATDQYKVVRIKSNRNKSSIAEVYTLGSEDSSWRLIPDGPCFECNMKVNGNVFLAGSLHWIGDRNFIITFSLGTEEFGDIQPPSQLPYLSCYKTACLGVLGEYLCFMYPDFQSCYFSYVTNVWVMEKYKDQTTWTKKYGIRPDVLRGQSDRFVLIKLMNNGELLILFNGHDLGYYDPKTCIFRPIKTPGGLFRRGGYAFLHVESLISPSNIAKFPTCRGYFSKLLPCIDQYATEGRGYSSGEGRNQEKGSNSGTECYSGRKSIHIATFCPNKGWSGRGRSSWCNAACFNYNEQGHLLRDCPKLRVGTSRRTCYSCGKPGHLARNCNNKGGTSRNTCYNCGKPGHLARNCNTSRGTCYNCGKPGHFARSCNNNCSLECYKCGKLGHFANKCFVK